MFRLFIPILQGSLYLNYLECLDDIARFNVIVFVNADTAFHSCEDFLSVVFAALE